MTENFSANFFSGNRERLRTLFAGAAPIVLTANGLVQKATDESFPFRQDGSFWYLTGIDAPEAVLVMDKGREYLILPSRETVVEMFDGEFNLDAIKETSGITDVVFAKEGWKRLGARLSRVKHVATLAANPEYIEFLGLYSNPARRMLAKRIKDCNSEITFLDLRQHLARMRMVKQTPEIAALRQAIAITTDTLKEIMKPRRMAKYTHEYQIEADLTYGFRMRGASGHSFDPIVASGVRGCTIHSMSNNAPLVADELLLFDVGAASNHYMADIARTISINSKPSRRQQQVFDAVVAVRDYAYSLLKPGIVLEQYEKQVEQFMGEKLRELGLIKTIDSESVRRFFPHRTSHFLGIDTHDSGDYEYPLEPGVVITVEPGIYIPQEKIGVRIEDDVLITENGMEVLSHDLPVKLA